MPQPWFIYLIRCADGALYTGISTDPDRRLLEHGGNRGARRLRGRGPLQLVFVSRLPDRTTALRVEGRIKRWPKTRKERLVRGEVELPAPEVDST